MNKLQIFIDFISNSIFESISNISSLIYSLFNKYIKFSKKKPYDK